MSENLPFSENLPTTPKNSRAIFLLLLLIASLSLNVYLGWSIKRLKAIQGNVQNSIELSRGMTIQPITVMSLSGRQETITYADYSKPTVFYIFSPTCHWCERNIQNINALVSLKGESFRFIGLSLADDGLTEYVESHRFSFPIYKSLTPDTIRMLGLAGTPQTIIISPEGRVLENWVGAFGERLEPQVEEYFKVRLPGLTAEKN